MHDLGRRGGLASQAAGPAATGLDAFYDDPSDRRGRTLFRQHANGRRFRRLLRGRSGQGARCRRRARHRQLCARARRICGHRARTRSQRHRRRRGDPGAGRARPSCRSTWSRSFPNACRLPMTLFDVVFARAVLHHTRDLDGACREMFRVLRPGGIFIAAREHVISKEADLGQFLDQHPLHHLYGGEHAFLLDRYIGALNERGFFRCRGAVPVEESDQSVSLYDRQPARCRHRQGYRERYPLSRCGASRSVPIGYFESLLSVAGALRQSAGTALFVCLPQGARHDRSGSPAPTVSSVVIWPAMLADSRPCRPRHRPWRDRRSREAAYRPADG